MQGDIFQLNTVQRQGLKSWASNNNTKPSTPTKHQGPTTAQVSIYNEDDLSDILFLPTRAFDDLEIHRHATATEDHAHYLNLIASTFNDYRTDTLYDSSDDCAVFSDDEDELQTPADESLPTLYSRVESITTAVPNAKDLGTDMDKTICHDQQTQNSEDGRVVQLTQHVSSIDGPLMSWWPLPVEMQEYDWDDGKDDIETRLTRQESNNKEKIMSWWPLPVDSMEYDWNEKFYE